MKASFSQFLPSTSVISLLSPSLTITNITNIISRGLQIKQGRETWPLLQLKVLLAQSPLFNLYIN